jgi:O-antigen/teichoic acid export membrane protein
VTASERQVPPFGSRLLARNVVLSLVSQVLPAVAAVVSLPVLASSLGAERLGILTLAWLVVGYFSFFDLGLGRALTQVVAARLSTSEASSLPGVIWTAWTALAAVGLLAAIGAGAAAYSITELLSVPAYLQEETRLSFYVLAASIPLLTLSAGTRGVLEAMQRFDLVAIVRTPAAAFTYLGPVLVLPFSTSVVPPIMVLVVARATVAVAFLALSLRALPMLRAGVRPRLEHLRDLASSGLWMTIANVFGAVIAVSDRLVIGSLLSVAAVAYYAAPQELITKLTVVPMAFGTVMFPAFSALAESDRAGQTRLFAKTVFHVYLALFPITILGAAFAPELLQIWIGADFARQSQTVGRVFCGGVLLLGLGVVPYGLLQARRKAWVTALLQCIELPVYVGLLWWAAGQFGIVGAAVVWLLRLAIDSLALFLCSQPLLSADAGRLRSTVVTMSVLTVAAFAAVAGFDSLLVRATLLSVIFVGLGLALPLLTEAADRARVVDQWRRLIARVRT